MDPLALGLLIGFILGPLVCAACVWGTNALILHTMRSLMRESDGGDDDEGGDGSGYSIDVPPGHFVTFTSTETREPVATSRPRRSPDGGDGFRYPIGEPRSGNLTSD